MGTRGFLGVVVDGEEKIAYVHFDSYVSGVGVEVLKELHELVKDIELFKTRARTVQVVGEESPTPAQVEALAAVTDLGVSTGSTEDWYCLLRETQGSLVKTLEAGYMEDSHNFPLDSLFCEYGYLVDLDRGTFEVYRGFQKVLPETGRWAGRPTAEEDAKRYADHIKGCAKSGREPWEGETAEYKAVALWHAWDLNNLPDQKTFLSVLSEGDDDE